MLPRRPWWELCTHNVSRTLRQSCPIRNMHTRRTYEVDAPALTVVGAVGFELGRRSSRGCVCYVFLVQAGGGVGGRHAHC